MNTWLRVAALMFAGVIGATRVACAAGVPDETRSGDWRSYGRTYSEQRFSPLQEITAANVQRLGLAWSLDLPGIKSLEATPLEIDGTLYFSGNDSIVFAVDARTGKQRWRHDPRCGNTPAGATGCCFPPIAASPSGRVGSTWGRTTAGCWRSTPLPGKRSGRCRPSRARPAT